MTAVSSLSIVDQDLQKLIDIYTTQNPDVWSIAENDDSLHSLFLYPAMMVPGVQKIIVDMMKQLQPSIQSVLDPFVGAGTSLVAAMYQGLDCYGQDINPLAVLLSRTRLGPTYNINIRGLASDLIERTKDDKNNTIEVNFSNMDKWFKKEVSIDLSKIRRAIQEEEDLWTRRFLWITLAETVRFTSNDRTSTYKLHARPIDEIESRDVNVINIFENLLMSNINKFELFSEALFKKNLLNKGQYIKNTKVICHDILENVITNDRNTLFDLVVTSPPYGDNTTTVPYGQHSYLPLQWIDFADIDTDLSDRFLRTTQEIDNMSIGGRSKITDDTIEKLSNDSDNLREIFVHLQPMSKDKILKVAVFYRDFFKAIDNIVGAMNHNAYSIWIVGNRTVGGISIATDSILRDYMSIKGVDFVTSIDRRIHNKRMPNRNITSNTMVNERILFFRKKG